MIVEFTTKFWGRKLSEMQLLIIRKGKFLLPELLNISILNLKRPKTVISREYPQEWDPGKTFPPINDEKNGKLYAEYEQLAKAEKNVIFSG